MVQLLWAREEERKSSQPSRAEDAEGVFCFGFRAWGLVLSSCGFLRLFAAKDQSWQTGWLTSRVGSRIHLRMTKILTLRLDQELLGKAEARAARLGLDRAKYVRSLIEEDLAGNPVAPPRKFASEDLAGVYEGPGTVATNASVRERLRKSSTGQRA